MRKTIEISSKAKQIRACVIHEYMLQNGYDHCVCFSCGNATRALKAEGVSCISISPDGDLTANRWWSISEVRKAFANAFDATSGHLPIDVLIAIAKKYREAFSDVFVKGKEYVIPTGSGETVFCLSMAFKDIKFIAQWRKDDPSCEMSVEAPMTEIIKSFIEWEEI